MNDYEPSTRRLTYQLDRLVYTNQVSEYDTRRGGLEIQTMAERDIMRGLVRNIGTLLIGKRLVVRNETEERSEPERAALTSEFRHEHDILVVRPLVRKFPLLAQLLPESWTHIPTKVEVVTEVPVQYHTYKTYQVTKEEWAIDPHAVQVMGGSHLPYYDRVTFEGAGVQEEVYDPEQRVSAEEAWYARY